MRFRTLAALLVLGSAALACSKDSDKTTVAVSDLPDGAVPRKFEPDPLGTIPPMSDPDPDPIPTGSSAVASPLPSGSAAHAPSAVASGGAPGAADPTRKTTVKLVAAGDAPRKKLRYKFAAGQNELATIDLTIGISVEAGPDSEPEQKLPTLRFSVVFGMKSVSPEGDLAYEFQLAGVDAAKDAHTPPQLQQAMRAMLGQMRGMSGTGSVSSRGVVKNVVMNIPPAASPQTQMILQQLQEIASDIAAPFPEEEVGKGAKWERAVKIETPDVKVQQKSSYTLVDVNDAGGTVSVVVVQNTPAGAIQPAGIPSSSGVRVDTMTTNGTGTTTFNLGRFAPTSTADTVTIVGLSGQQGGETKHAKMVTKANVKISGTLAPAQ